MIALKLDLPESTYTALKNAAHRSHKSESEIAMAAIEEYLEQFSDVDPLFGLFADDPQLIDQIEADTMQAREKAALRLNDVTGR